MTACLVNWLLFVFKQNFLSVLCKPKASIDLSFFVIMPAYMWRSIYDTLVWSSYVCKLCVCACVSLCAHVCAWKLTLSRYVRHVTTTTLWATQCLWTSSSTSCIICDAKSKRTKGMRPTERHSHVPIAWRNSPISRFVCPLSVCVCLWLLSWTVNPFMPKF